MDKVFCFGELLLRMSPELNRQWIRESSIPVYVGGAELNVATALSNWGLRTKYCTALPANYLSQEILDELTEKKIDISPILISGKRIGTYYLPQGTDLKNAGVIYERDHSSFSELKTGMIDWNEALKDCNWFHFSAISPALNENIAAVCEEGLKAATDKGLTISIDLNYRSKLWQYGKQPAEMMKPLAKYCHVIMGNIWAAGQLLDIPVSIQDSKERSSEELIAAAGQSMKQIHFSYPAAQTMAYTFRLDKNYFAVLQHGSEMAVSKEFALDHIVDKVGSGDCFMGGLIYGLYHKHSADTIINFAAAAAVGKMRETGDSTRQSAEHVKAIMQETGKTLSIGHGA